ncbi:MAG TPA: hypothetical protein VKB88_18755 [Bryobacteraceae bacterium]|nr:hypothetical protein [Bryobacteraceae bacterium]
MVHSVNSRSMSQHQITLLERALRVLAKLDEGGWQEMPPDLHIPFAKYMDAEAWTHLPDLLTLREAALMIVRDAIARTGEFSPEAPQQEHDTPPQTPLVAETR